MEYFKIDCVTNSKLFLWLYKINFRRLYPVFLSLR